MILDNEEEVLWVSFPECGFRVTRKRIRLGSGVGSIH